MKTETELEVMPVAAGRDAGAPGTLALPEPVLPETLVLEAAAAKNADIAAAFLRRKTSDTSRAHFRNRSVAREHLARAIQQLNEAEIE